MLPDPIDPKPETSGFCSRDRDHSADGKRPLENKKEASGNPGTSQKKTLNP